MITQLHSTFGSNADYSRLVEDRPIDALETYFRKAHTHPDEQTKLLAESIRVFGFVEPVLVTPNDEVIVGYGRILAAKRLGWTHVPTLQLSHLNEAQIRAYRIASNRIAEKAGWDREHLALEFKDLEGQELTFSLDVTGFSFEEREALVFGQSRAEEAEDNLPSPVAQVVTRPGDLWLCGDHRVMQGDALSPQSFAMLLDGEPVQVVFTDPPYNVPTQGHITSNAAHDDFVQGSGEMSEAEFAGFLANSMATLATVLAPGGALYAFMDWRSIAPLITGVVSAELRLLNLIVWAKPVGGMGSMYRSQHELIVFAAKPGAPHRNNVQLGRHGRNRSNVWTYDGVGGFGAEKARLRELHPTVKPVPLIRDALLDCSEPGDLVCDPYSGSGSTLIACETAGRRARVMDLDPKYVDVTVRRWQDFTGRQAIHAVTGQTFSEMATTRAKPAVRVRRRSGQEA